MVKIGLGCAEVALEILMNWHLQAGIGTRTYTTLHNKEKTKLLLEIYKTRRCIIFSSAREVDVTSNLLPTPKLFSLAYVFIEPVILNNYN